MLVSLAQDMLSKRPISLSSLQHNIKGTTGSMIAKDMEEANKVHIIGVHWFHRFMLRHLDFKLAFVQYQEGGRKAAADPELQQHFFRLLANLVRRQNVQEEDIWNCVLLWAEMELEIWL